MDQQLTEDQQRAAHKIIVANRGDCSGFLSCCDCPNFFNSCDLPSPEFQAENLRTSQAWLDEHITDAEILAESPREFCERMVRTGKCKSSGDYCDSCVKCNMDYHKTRAKVRAKAYLASHSATPQEPPKRRPTPEEMVVGATVRVRLWDELVRDGLTILAFTLSMRKFCGNTYKIIKRAGFPYLEGCADWTFTPEMLDYVEPEKVVSSDYELSRRDRVDWASRIAKQFEFERALVPAAIVKAPTPVSHRIIALEGQVDDLTKKLSASKKLCERLQRRLRAKWEAKRDGEMATEEEIVKWWQSNLGGVEMRSKNPKDWKVHPNGCTTWIPATRGNLKL